MRLSEDGVTSPDVASERPTEQTGRSDICLSSPTTVRACVRRVLCCVACAATADLQTDLHRRLRGLLVRERPGRAEDVARREEDARRRRGRTAAILFLSAGRDEGLVARERVEVVGPEKEVDVRQKKAVVVLLRGRLRRGVMMRRGVRARPWRSRLRSRFLRLLLGGEAQRVDERREHLHQAQARAPDAVLKVPAKVLDVDRVQPPADHLEQKTEERARIDVESKSQHIT